MLAGEKPALANAVARSRRALSNTSEWAPEWAWSSPATKIAAQLAKAPPAAAGELARANAATIARRKAPSRATRWPAALLVVLERRRQRRAGRLGQQPAFAVVELALGEGDRLAPADHPPDAAHRSRHSRPEEARLHLQRWGDSGH